MRTIFLSVIILFLLTACGVAAPISQTSEVSETSEVYAPTLTATATITLTPLPTFTPTPAFPSEFLSLGLDPAEYQFSEDGTQIINKTDGSVTMVKAVDGKWVEPVAHIPVSDEVKAQVEEKLAAGGYTISTEDKASLLDKDGDDTGLDVVVISGLESVVLQRIGDYEGQSFVERTPLRLVGVSESGELDIEGLKWNQETNLMEPVNTLYPVLKSDEVVETDIQLKSVSYALESLRREAQKIKDQNEGVLPEEVRTLGYGSLIEIVNNSWWKVGDRLYRAKFSGTMHEGFESSSITVWNLETNQFEEVETMKYLVTTFGGEPKTQYGYLVFIDADGNKREIFIDRVDLNDGTSPKNRKNLVHWESA
jgi:hypothetical protein